ncbi:alpha/beta fold hydrolase [Streptomyces sp. NPDC001663]|uniref:alpha/beta fold hydrolase n=1 Tax=Streptomyces sp. NPDC001663 TaxID=3364597 RepID=UPI0036D19884
MQKYVQLGVVFVHGFNSVPTMWDTFRALLDEDPDLAAVQALTFGYDTRVWQPHPLRRIPTFDTVADSLKEFLDTDAEDFNNLVLVSHSQGGLVVQRYLARMLVEGRGEDLARIRQVVLFACPNNGSQLALTLRRALLRRNPQEQQLRPLNEQITDTQRIILRDVINAGRVTERTCPISFSVYAAETDNIVTAAAARSVFPDAAVLPGDHFSIVQPGSRAHRSYTTLKRLLLAAVDGDPPVLRATLAGLGPATLEVHNAATPGKPPSSDVSLTPYLHRAHDSLLRDALVPVLAGGPSRLFVLTGESSTGKTRALYQAVHDLGPTLPLLKPITSGDLLDLLRKGTMAVGTVLWLNEAQRFLYGRVGEEAAADLQRVLQRRPGVAALATLWPDYWNELAVAEGTAKLHTQVRALLTHPSLTIRIPVPPQLTTEDFHRWQDLIEVQRDQRLSDAWAAGRADGRVIQHLSGGPELLAAYLAGPGTHFTHQEYALLTAGLDARRLGHRAPLPPALLADAADGALAPHHRSSAADWSDQVLDALATGRRPDGTRTDIRNTLSALTVLRARSGAAARYDPADYLAQQTRRLRADQLGTPSLWQALLEHTTDPDDVNNLAQAAWQRGLYRHGVLLWRKAVLTGHSRAPTNLVAALPPALDPHQCVPQWVAVHSSLTDPVAVADLLETLKRTGAREAMAALLDRDPATHTTLTDPDGVARLLHELRTAGADEAVAALLDRDPATHTALTDALAVARLLEELQGAGASEAVDTLAQRAADVDLTDHGVAGLLRELWMIGAIEALNTLAQRAADHIDLTNPPTVTELLDVLNLLEEVGDCEAVTALLDRDPATHTTLTNPHEVANLLQELRRAGASAAVDTLAQRAADIDLTDPDGVAHLLQELRAARASEALDTLMRRAADGDLSDPDGVAQLLQELRTAEASEAVVALLDRDPATHTTLTDPDGVARLLRELRTARADEAVAALLDRDPATHTTVTNPSGVASLLQELRTAGADEAVDTLTQRAADHVDVEDPYSVTDLLRELRRAGAAEVLDALAQRAADRVDLTYHFGYDELLEELRTVGASLAADTLTHRAANAGVGTLQSASPYGRTADGQPAAPWSWSDLTQF